MPLTVKTGVNIDQLCDEMVDVLPVVNRTFMEHGFGCTITAGKDGQHMKGSLHYVGEALDFRSVHIAQQEMKNKILAELKDKLGSDFDCLFEGTAAGRTEHYHVEYDPS